MAPLHEAVALNSVQRLGNGNWCEPLSAAVGEGPESSTPRAAGSVGPVRQRDVWSRAHVRDDVIKAALLGVRPISVQWRSSTRGADIRARIEPLTMALRRDLVTRNSPEEALPRWVHRGLAVARFTLAALLRDHNRKPLAELPRVASGRLGKSPIGCDPINRPGG
jgi:hypothetical protein